MLFMSQDDKSRNVSTERYLEEISTHLSGLINKLKDLSGTCKIYLSAKIIFKSLTDDGDRQKYLNTKNVYISIG